MTTPLCHGGYADVWKGEHQGREVAVKVLKVYLTSDFDEITRVGYTGYPSPRWRADRYQCRDSARRS